jgi:hypothetical protein
MKSAALTLVVALSLSASAFAQQEPRNEREYREDYDQLIFSLRTIIPGGEALPGSRWNDVVSGGLGLGVEYSSLTRLNSWIYGGWYVGAGIDSYGGKSITDDTGEMFRTHRLNTANLEFGGRLRQNFSGFHVDENIGAGGLFYMKQEIDDRSSGEDNLEFIKSSASYMFDVGLRLGAPIGKDVELNIGFAYQVNGAPSRGKDFTGFKFKEMQNYVFSLGLDIGF